MARSMVLSQRDWPKSVDSLPASLETSSLERNRSAISELRREGAPGSRVFPAKTKHIETTPPEPCPPFVFPERPISSPSSINSSFSRRPISAHSVRANRQGQNTEDSGPVKRNSANTLPPFDFNPGASPRDPATGMTSPPLSPTSSLAIPSRAGGHRRGGSEFIGGDGKLGGPGLMSTSPTKGDGVLPPPSPSPSLKPPPGRRGHAHRRSGAISCHDLSMILKPAEANLTGRGGSAPVSPCYPDIRRGSLPALDFSEQPQEPNINNNAYKSSRDDDNQAWASEKEAGARRSRVGFSETVEFIPRPLSVISSETSSTLTTVRGHSVSGSISSIASGNGSSPHHGRERGASLGTTFEDQTTQPRPSTAGAVLSGSGGAKKTAFGDFIPSSKRPSSASASPSTSVGSPVTPRFPPKKRHHFGFDRSTSTSHTDVTVVATDVPLKNTETSKPGYLQSPPTSPTTAPSCQDSSGQATQHRDEPKRPSDSKSEKKQKKVKTWIFSRKSKHKARKQKLARRSPTPPPLPTYTPANVPSSSEFEFSNEPSYNFSPETGSYGWGSHLTPDFSRPNIRMTGGSSYREPESMSPVVDLDAALGPFNTPMASPDFDNPSRNGFTLSKRRMHSSGRTGGFVGPGMHYHRRTESAPEMSPFDWSEFGIHRLGSNSTMADVFEEDEEYEDEEIFKNRTMLKGRRARSEADAENEEGLGIGIQVVDAENMKDNAVMDWTVESENGFIRGAKRSTTGFNNSESRPQLITGVRQERSTGSLASQAIPEESNAPLEISNDNEIPCSSSDARSSDSTITAPVLPDELKVTHEPINTRLYSPGPMYLVPDTPSSVGSSSFPSPAFMPSAFDMDGRLPTARSSFTDDPTFESLLLNGPGPELRMSVDDVPSLTSSSSTMTSGVNFNSQFGPTFEGRQPGERTMSMSSTRSNISAARKRSSLASLSRLVGSSHGEKSKLSNELNAQADLPDRTAKDKKEKRWSRMMQFLKPSKGSA